MEKITFPHKSRADQVSYICNIYGYYSNGARQRFPIEFDVSCTPDLSFPALWMYYKEYIPQEICEDPDKFKMYRDEAKRIHALCEGSLWEWGVEDARDSLDNDEFYRTVGGATVDVKYELHGRGGKHLLITEFNGHSLRGLSEDDLEEEMLTQTLSNGEEYIGPILKSRAEWTNWSTEDVVLFYKTVRSCKEWFSHKSVNKQAQYYAAFMLFERVNDAYDEALKSKESHDDIVEAARDVFAGIYTDAITALIKDKKGEGLVLLESFSKLAKAAGLSDEELHDVSMTILPIQQ